ERSMTTKKTPKARKPAKGKAAGLTAGKVTKVPKTAKGKGSNGNGKAQVPARQARADSKQAQFIAAMQTKDGISITEAAERFGWQQHTVRGAIAGAIKKKLKL